MGLARLRNLLIYNALCILPPTKKLCFAREFFLDTHGERGLASCLANAALDCASKRSRVDCHNDSAHIS